MQLAHYTRMLQACGRHPGDELLFGAIIGTSEVAVHSDTPPERVFAWHNLDEPVVYYLLAQPWEDEAVIVGALRPRARLPREGRSPGSPDRRKPRRPPSARHADRTGRVCLLSLRGPLRRGDGRRSIGGDHGGQVGHPRVAHAAVDGRYHDPRTRRGWTSMTRRSSPHTPRKSPTTVPRQARKRLAAAVERAAMIRDGIDFWPNGAGPVEVPTATVEIDVDIESDQDSRVYMWGARTRRSADDATAPTFPTSPSGSRWTRNPSTRSPSGSLGGCAISVLPPSRTEERCGCSTGRTPSGRT